MYVENKKGTEVLTLMNRQKYILRIVRTKRHAREVASTYYTYNTILSIKVRTSQ